MLSAWPGSTWAWKHYKLAHLKFAAGGLFNGCVHVPKDKNVQWKAQESAFLIECKMLSHVNLFAFVFFWNLKAYFSGSYERPT